MNDNIKLNAQKQNISTSLVVILTNTSKSKIDALHSYLFASRTRFDGL